MNSSEKIRLRSQLRGSLLGVIIGDAMGGPVECMKDPEEIRTMVGGPVTGFLDPRELRTDDVPEDCGPGSPSDDWQQTFDVGMSIVECKGFNLEHSIKRQIDSWKKSPYGAGGTTRNAFREMDAWFRTGGKEGRSPHVPPPFVKNRGAGNGPAMKIAPIFFYHSDQSRGHNTQLMLENAYDLSRATHGDIRATIAAFSVLWTYLGIFAKPEEKQALFEGRNFLPSVHRIMRKVEHDQGTPDPDNTYAFRFSRLRQPGALDSTETLRKTTGTTSLCWESVPFSIGVFLRHPKDFRAGILEAVNAGGDTDTNASIAGGLIGAEVGENGIPAEWRTFHPRFEEAISLADALTDLIANREY